MYCKKVLEWLKKRHLLSEKQKQILLKKKSSSKNINSKKNTKNNYKYIRDICACDKANRRILIGKTYLNFRIKAPCKKHDRVDEEMETDKIGFQPLSEKELIGNSILYLTNKIPNFTKTNLVAKKYSFKARTEYLNEYQTAIESFSTSSDEEETIPKFTFPLDKLAWREQFTDLKNAITMEIKCYVFLRKFLSLWLFKKYAKVALNDQDPFTLEEIKPNESISIFSPKQRGSWLFNAKALRKHLESSLIYTYELFPEPSIPKHPLTNIPFTKNEMNMLISRLEIKNESSWILQGIREKKYNLTAFVNVFGIPIKLAALKSLCKDKNMDEYYYALQDFIDDEMYYHGYTHTRIETRRTLFWAVKNKSDDIYLQGWHKAFYDFKNAEILGVENETSLHPEIICKQRVHDMTYRLLHSLESISRLTQLRLGKPTAPHVSPVVQIQPQQNSSNMIQIVPLNLTNLEIVNLFVNELHQYTMQVDSQLHFDNQLNSTDSDDSKESEDISEEEEEEEHEQEENLESSSTVSTDWETFTSQNEIQDQDQNQPPEQDQDEAQEQRHTTNSVPSESVEEDNDL